MKKEYTLRHPVVNGLFYPDGKEELENITNGYIERVDSEALYAKIAQDTGFDGPENLTPLVLIAPHAGYIFSGKVQAYAYSLLINKKIDTVIIIGPAHQKSFTGISVNLDDAYKTPLGLVKVDLDFAGSLIAFDKKIMLDEEAHLSEHGVEVQLPFVQTVLPKASIVSILLGEQNSNNSELLKNALVSVVNKYPKKYVVIVSSDLSHYHPHVEAQSIDSVLIDDIRSMDDRRFIDNIRSGNSEACGFGGILAGMLLSKKIGKSKSSILFHMDSGDVSGDRNKVVGYLAAVFY
jgi:AmmeMemoRadiSam system protein B